MVTNGQKRKNLITYFFILVLMTLLVLWLISHDVDSSWHQAGLTNLSLGVLLLTAYVCSRILKIVKLPLISGYIFAGIIIGPYVSGFLTVDMVERLRLADDLALNFIAFTAGGSLQMKSLRKLGRSIVLNIILLTSVVFGLVFFFVVFSGRNFNLTDDLTSVQLIVLAVLLGVVSVARSPSSAIAIISECRASGKFTETVLGVTVAMDVLIIVLFTFALTISKIILTGSGVIDHQVLAALSLEMAVSFILGGILGKGISVYMNRVGHDLLLFLLFIAFGATKVSAWMSGFMEYHFHISLHLEPLLICMSAGFFVQNFSKNGGYFLEVLNRMALPIYVVFFSLAGASLSLEALKACWPIALCLVFVRATGIFLATWLAGTISAAPPVHTRHAWMAYITQAGVAIGLAQLANSQFPEIGGYLITIVLAVITINQIVGPVTFKVALHRVKEARGD